MKKSIALQCLQSLLLQCCVNDSLFWCFALYFYEEPVSVGFMNDEKLFSTSNKMIYCRGTLYGKTASLQLQVIKKEFLALQ